MVAVRNMGNNSKAGGARIQHSIRQCQSAAVQFVELLENRNMDLVRIILAVLLPPLGVFLQVGLGLHFWLNILLTLCGYIPGLVHAIWIIAKVGPK